MTLTGLPDFARTLTLPDGPVWAAYGRDVWLAPATELVMGERDGGAPAFQLSIIRPPAPFLPPPPFGSLDMTLVGRRDLEQALVGLRAATPGAALAGVAAAEGRLRLSAADADVVAPDEFDRPVELTLSGDGDARLLQRLSADSALLMERMLIDGIAPFIAAGAMGFRGVSPRVAQTAEFDPGALIGDLSARIGADPLSRDQFASHIEAALDDLPIAYSERVDIGTRAGLSQTLADRIAARFGQPVETSASEAPEFTLPAASQIGHGRFTWDLRQPLLTTRWITVSADPFRMLRAFLAERGPDALVRRSVLTGLPRGAERIDAYANIAHESPELQALGITLTAPPAPPHRPSAAVASAMFPLPALDAALTLRLAPGETLAYQAQGFAILADAAGVRRVEGEARAAGERILTLTAADFGMAEATLEAAPALLALAEIGGEARYRVGEQDHAIPIRLTEDAPKVALCIPATAEDGALHLSAFDRSGDGALALDPAPLRSARLDLAQFPGYGPQEARISCAPSASGAIIAIEVMPETAENASDFETLAFREGATERLWRYFSRSPFTPGFKWRLASAPDGAWRRHADPAAPLVVEPSSPPP